MKLIFFLVIISISNLSLAQPRLLDLNLIPGLGTSGLNHDGIRNLVSLNILSGYSDRTLLLQLSGISGTNRTYSGGLQIAGIANITGANLKSLNSNFKEELIPTIHLNGIQISGLMNIVRGDVSGGQVSLLFNLSEEELIGAQISGLANFSGGYTLGTQIGLLANKTTLGLGGVQLSLGKNTVGAEMSGLQLGTFNEAYNIEGKNSETNRSGLQIGLVNNANKMFGYQIGLINIAKHSGGTQIGLINIYRPRINQANTIDGTALGLINIGSVVFLSTYIDEMYLFNYELSTGNVKNRREQKSKYNKYIANSVIFSHNPHQNNSFGIGFSVKKMFFNRSNLPGKAESKFFGYTAEIKVLKKDEIEGKDKKVLVSGFDIFVGRRIIPKLFGVNAYLSLGQHIAWGDSYYRPGMSIAFSEGTLFEIPITTWTGVSVGILLH